MKIGILYICTGTYEFSVLVVWKLMTKNYSHKRLGKVTREIKHVSVSKTGWLLRITND